MYLSLYIYIYIEREVGRLAHSPGPASGQGLYLLGEAYTILYYTILYYTIQYYIIILYYTILYYTILYYTILYYTIL